MRLTEEEQIIVKHKIKMLTLGALGALGSREYMRVRSETGQLTHRLRAKVLRGGGFRKAQS